MKTFRVAVFAALALGLVLGIAPAQAGKPAKPRPNVQFKSASYNVNESATNAQVLITLSAKASGTVHFHTAGGTATGAGACDAGVDYVAQPDTTVTFTNETQKIVNVVLCPDSLYEGSGESVLMQLDNAGDGLTLGSRIQATLMIKDDDPAPTISIGDDADDEGEELSFTVSISGSSALPVSVEYATADDTALGGSPGEDYDSTSGTLVWAPGDTTDRTITVQTHDDGKYANPDEQFFVDLSNPINGSFGDSQGVGTLNELSVAPELTIADPEDFEDNTNVACASAPCLLFTVTLDAASDATTTVQYDVGAYGGDTATGGATCDTDVDYVSVDDGTVTFDPGDTEKKIEVQLCGDSDVEADETFTVELHDPTNATLGTPDEATGTIKNDDA